MDSNIGDDSYEIENNSILRDEKSYNYKIHEIYVFKKTYLIGTNISDRIITEFYNKVKLLESYAIKFLDHEIKIILSTFPHLTLRKYLGDKIYSLNPITNRTHVDHVDVKYKYYFSYDTFMFNLMEVYLINCANSLDDYLIHIILSNKEKIYSGELPTIY